MQFSCHEIASHLNWKEDSEGDLNCRSAVKIMSGPEHRWAEVERHLGHTTRKTAEAVRAADRSPRVRICKFEMKFGK